MDILLLHRPSPLMHPDEIFKAIETLMDQGKIKSFGVSNFTNYQTKLISSKSKVNANQIKFSLTHHSALFDSSLDYMVLNKIIPMSWSPLGSVFKEKSDKNKSFYLIKNFKFKNFTMSQEFVIQVGNIAEIENHHQAKYKRNQIVHEWFANSNV